VGNKFISWISAAETYGAQFTLSDIAPERRYEHLEFLAQACQRRLLDRFPETAEYRHTLRQNKPFNDQGCKHVSSFRIYVHRGWFWGYEVTLYPSNPDIDHITLTIRFDIRLVWGAFLLAGIIAAAAVIGMIVVILRGERRPREGGAFFAIVAGSVFGACLFLCWVVSRLVEKTYCPSAGDIEVEMSALYHDLKVAITDRPS
jgi:hypothetical protein